jgi:type I restriction enzyme R subunit
MSKIIAESDVEEAMLELLKELGYKVLNGPEIAPDGEHPERSSYADVVLVERLENSIRYLNPQLTKDAVENVSRKITRLDNQEHIERNHTFHKYLTDGVDIEYRRADGKVVGEHVNLFDFDNPEKNEFLAVNQFTIKENDKERRPDILLFVNGLPVVIIELKNPAEETATIWTAYDQVLGTYMKEIPTLFDYNEIVVISDGLDARAGTFTSGKEWFVEWKTINGNEPKIKMSEIELLTRGMFGKDTLLNLIRHFIVFKHGRRSISKILAAYHQYNAVEKSIIATKKAVKSKDKRCGIVWHSTGGGKSFVMAFYAGKLALAKELNNPTIIVLTDRNDLDDQLFDTFSGCQDILRQTPIQAKDREDLKKRLNVASGGIIFTTIQKFLPEKGKSYPLLSARENIVVIADEAHRSQYEFIDGFARHLRDAIPNASFIGFTGTPIEKADRSTRAVFGDEIDVYDMTQAIEDKATVKIYYESRLARLELKPEERPKIDPEFEEVTEDEEETSRERLKSKWAQLEKVVGSPERVKRLAKDIVDHYEKRLNVLEGKAMIVCMSRRICIDLHNEIVKLRPKWYDKSDEKGLVKVVITGSATDPVDWQEHIRNRPKRRALGDHFKDPSSPFKLAIVRDMWLTGFDAPSLHTMYVDKPMRGHNLIQAISRVNRVFKDKPGGLIVDYIGIGLDLKAALAEYTTKDKENVGIEQEQAVKLMLENYDIVKDIMHGFDYKKFLKATPKEKLSLLPYALEHILKQEDGEKRFLKYVSKLSKAFALSVPSPKALELKDEVGIFQMLKVAITKKTASKHISHDEQLDTAIKQIVSSALISDRVIDVFAAAGLGKPDISILSDEFLAEVKQMPQKNLAFETLKKLINDQINIKFKRNIIQKRSFTELLEKTVKKYHNRSLETAQLIQELIDQAKDIREVTEREKQLKLDEDEVAFYDALANNKSAVDVLGDEKLMTITRELVKIIHENTSIDWTIKETVKAKLRLLVKRVLRKYGYPPDQQRKAIDLVLEHATVLSENH